MNREEILDIFRKTGAVLEGHFLLSSGLHSDRYFQMALVLQHPVHAKRLAEDLAVRFAGERIDAVVGPALGGVVLSYQLAQVLNARSLFSERQDGVVTLRRGFRIAPAEKVLVCEDVITTGGSAREVVALVQADGGDVRGVCCLVQRGKADFDCRMEALVTMEASNYDSERCPLCARNIPCVKPGSRGR
jgi:orotate phosphoribosyltransferase